MTSPILVGTLLGSRGRLALDLPRIADATHIASPTQVSLAGFVGEASSTAGLPENPPNPTVGLLEGLLYQHAFCNPLGSTPATPSGAAPHDLLPALSAANTSKDRVDSFWEYVQSDTDGRCVLRRGIETRSVWPGEFVSHLGPGVSLYPGAPVSLFVARESVGLQLGFYFAFGEAIPDPNPAWVRLYFNVRPAGAALLVARTTELLNWLQVPFRMKCLTSSAQLNRTDGAVLYVHRRRYSAVCRVLPELYRSVSTTLASACCLFAKPLAPGLSLAEDPPGGGSFGMSRCRMLAEGLYSAWASGVHDGSAKVAAMRRALIARGVSPDTPFLNPGSVDHYDIPQELGHVSRHHAA